MQKKNLFVAASPSVPRRGFGDVVRAGRARRPAHSDELRQRRLSASGLGVQKSGSSTRLLTTRMRTLHRKIPRPSRELRFHRPPICARFSKNYSNVECQGQILGFSCFSTPYCACANHPLTKKTKHLIEGVLPCFRCENKTEVEIT